MLNLTEDEIKLALERLVRYDKPLLGAAELADIFGMSPSRFANIRRRSPERFVGPDYELSMGPIWRRETIIFWVQRETSRRRDWMLI